VARDRVADEVHPAAERAHNEGALYPLQDRLLAVAATYGTDLVLTGGTGLARCYVAHRYSDDTDRFTLQPHAGVVGRDLANPIDKTLSVQLDPAGANLNTVPLPPNPGMPPPPPPEVVPNRTPPFTEITPAYGTAPFAAPPGKA
jgi:hypothetical protein